MLRAAALPLHNVRQAPCDPRFEEAVALASPSLHARINSDGQNAQHRPKVDRALDHYARRMATRPTPFGLFAGVGIGEFKPTGQLSLGALSDWRRHARPDMEWLLALVKALETDPNLCRTIRVFSNPLVMREGARFVLTNPSNWSLAINKDSKERPFNVSIRATPPVIAALELAKNGSALGVLVSDVALALGQADDERVESLLRSLLGREFLFSELRPPVSSSDPLRHVSCFVGRLSGQAALAQALSDVEAHIAIYANAPSSQATVLMQRVHDIMRPLTLSPRLLHVDLALPHTDMALPIAVGEEFGRAADAMWRLSKDEARLRHLRDYHADFLARFGFDREVALADLLHEELGLGPPRTYMEPPPTRSSGQNTPAQLGMTYLAELCYAAVALGQRELVLTEALLDELAPISESSSAPPSFELYAEVLAASPADLAKGAFQLVLSPIVGADDAGKTFGRFMYALPPSTAEALRRMHMAQAAAEPEVIHAELSYLPAGKLANVVLIPCLRDYEISVATCPSLPQDRSIPLADIAVGATPERLFLRSRSSGREVVVSATHMLNYQLLPNSLRLMLEISLSRTRPFALLDMGSLQGAAVYPRIVYGRTVLIPATWNLKRTDVAALGTTWRAGFQAWRERWSVPRHVFIGFADQRLWLDLDEGSHVDEIEERLRKADSVAIMEMIGSFEDRIFSSDGGRHFTECVVPLTRLEAAKPSRLPKTRFGQCETANARLHMPGTEWLYLKLYCNPDRLDRLLVEHVLPFAETCVAAGFADRWFYLFYKDPESHLRLRLHSGDLTGRSHLLEEAGRWAGALMGNGQIRDMSIAPYEREIERYGGVDLIGPAEVFFCKDSQLCARLVAAELSGQTRLDRIQLMAVGAADIAKRIGDLEHSRLFLSGKLKDRSRFSRLFQEVCAGIWSVGNREALGESAWIRTLLEFRAEALNDYLAVGRSKIPEDRSEAELQTIVPSLIHMQCNRMNGDERVALALAKHIVNWLVAVSKPPPQQSRA